MWKNAWFNKKTTRVGEMTARSTRLQTLEKNKEKGNQKSYVYRKEIKGKTHTHKRKSPRYATDQVQKKSVTSIEL